jgi:hypothetical protein
MIVKVFTITLIHRHTLMAAKCMPLQFISATSMAVKHDWMKLSEKSSNKRGISSSIHLLKPF